ncbi:hypothetical protein P0F11_003043 [Vibrio metschnikovii]|nr:hypothetical protein [Vibrio metschnikovii]
MVLIYYGICQVLLVPTLVIDIFNNEVGYGSIFSFFRPTFLCIAYLAILELIVRANIDKIFLVLKIVIFVSFCYALIELFLLDYFSEFVFSLYKREERLSLRFSSTTFYGTTYYSSFVYFTMALLMFSNFERTSRINNLIFTVLAYSLVMLTQSKAGMFALLLALCLMMGLSSVKWLRMALMCMIFSLVIIVLNINFVFDSLAEFNLVSVKQIYELIYHTEKSETLGDRMEQTLYSLEIVNSHLGVFGGGLVPQDGSLESWPALFLYRYGLFGVLNFILFSVFISALSLKPFFRKVNIVYPSFAKAGFAWGLTLPITQISTPMMELGKTAFIANFFLALLTISLRKKNFEAQY